MYTSIRHLILVYDYCIKRDKNTYSSNANIEEKHMSLTKMQDYSFRVNDPNYTVQTVIFHQSSYPGYPPTNTIKRVTDRE